MIAYIYCEPASYSDSLHWCQGPQDSLFLMVAIKAMHISGYIATFIHLCRYVYIPESIHTIIYPCPKLNNGIKTWEH